MAYYPDNHFIREFARRTLDNLDAIEGESERFPWPDSALISFLLAVFVLPHERADNDSFMAELLEGYSEPLSDVVKILKVRPSNDRNDGPPDRLEKIPAFLRNAVGHLNIRPESEDGQNLTHLLIWNRLPRKSGRDGKITFVARVNIEKLRDLARHILKELSKSGVGDRYEGIDPVAQFDRDWNSEDQRSVAD